MKKWIINTFAKLTGASKILKSVEGYKTYISGTALILTGAAGILTGVVGISDFAGVIDFVKGLPNNPAWLAILGGASAIGLRSAKEKKPVAKKRKK